MTDSYSLGRRLSRTMLRASLWVVTMPGSPGPVSTRRRISLVPSRPGPEASCRGLSRPGRGGEGRLRLLPLREGSFQVRLAGHPPDLGHPQEVPEDHLPARRVVPEKSQQVPDALAALPSLDVRPVTLFREILQ